MHVIVGHGDMNVLEAHRTLTTLAETEEAKGTTFWLAFPLFDALSETTERIIKWADNAGYYTWGLSAHGSGGDSVGSFTDMPEDIEEAQEGDSIVDGMIATMQSERNNVALNGQPIDVLVIFPEEGDLDDDTVLFINKAVRAGFPVYDLSGQMAEVVLEEEEPSTPVEPGEPEPEPEPLEAQPIKAAPSGPDLTADDYEDMLTLSELREQCEKLGLTVEGDKRSKTPYAEALATYWGGSEDEQPEPAVEEEPDTSTIPENELEEEPTPLIGTITYEPDSGEGFPITPAPEEVYIVTRYSADGSVSAWPIATVIGRTLHA